MDDIDFLRYAFLYIDRRSMLAAAGVLEGLTIDKACARHGGRLKVAMALLGRLKRAVVKDGRVTSARDYVDPFREWAVYDPDDKELMAAFAIFRTINEAWGPVYMSRRGERVNQILGTSSQQPAAEACTVVLSQGGEAWEAREKTTPTHLYVI